MMFDTDYLNSQKEKLNESISNYIRLTYLVICKFHHRIYVLLLPNFQRSFGLLLPPHFRLGVQSYNLFYFYQNYFCFSKPLTTRSQKQLRLIINYLKNHSLPKSGRQRYNFFTIHSKLFLPPFSKKK